MPIKRQDTNQLRKNQMKATMVAPASPSESNMAPRPSAETVATALVGRGRIIFLCAVVFSLVSKSSAANPSALRKKVKADDNGMNISPALALDTNDDVFDAYEARDETFETIQAELLQDPVGDHQEVVPFEEQVSEEEQGAVSALQDTLSSEEMRRMLVKMETENRELREQVLEKQNAIDTLTRRSLYRPENRAQHTLLTGLDESSPGVKEEVIDLIIKKFIAPTSEYRRFEKLSDAFEAIEFKVYDGEPVQVQGFPFLYVGTVGASMNYRSLMEHNITHVVNWSGSARCNVWQEMEYRCILGIHGADISKPENVKILSEAVDYVEEARLAGGSVLSHCWFGRNRSVTLLVAYLMKYAGMDMYEATRLIAKTRPQADPYIAALELYKEQYLERA